MPVTEELRAEVVTPSAPPARARPLIPIIVGVASVAVVGVVQLVMERRSRLSLVFHRIRPRALAWLVLAFGAVFVWHLAGSFASPR